METRRHRHVLRLHTRFPGDTPESIISDIEIIKRELPVDLLEFFYLTPLPGSEDHKKLHESGIAMDVDLNKYDLNRDRSSDNVAGRVAFDLSQSFEDITRTSTSRPF